MIFIKNILGKWDFNKNCLYKITYHYIHIVVYLRAADYQRVGKYSCSGGSQTSFVDVGLVKPQHGTFYKKILDLEAYNNNPLILSLWRSTSWNLLICQ